MEPTLFTSSPTNNPTQTTLTPSLEPTIEPTGQTLEPSNAPTMEPTIDSRIIRSVVCGDRLVGSIRSFETDFYKLINVPSNTLSIQLNSCGSGYDTWLQVFDDQFRLVYEWYVLDTYSPIYITIYFVLQ